MHARLSFYNADAVKPSNFIPCHRQSLPPSSSYSSFTSPPLHPYIPLFTDPVYLHTGRLPKPHNPASTPTVVCQLDLSYKIPASPGPTMAASPSAPLKREYTCAKAPMTPKSEGFLALSSSASKKTSAASGVSIKLRPSPE